LCVGGKREKSFLLVKAISLSSVSAKEDEEEAKEAWVGHKKRGKVY